MTISENKKKTKLLYLVIRDFDSMLMYSHLRAGILTGCSQKWELCGTIKVNCAAKKTNCAANCAAINS